MVPLLVLVLLVLVLPLVLLLVLQPAMVAAVAAAAAVVTGGLGFPHSAKWCIHGLWSPNVVPPPDLRTKLSAPLCGTCARSRTAKFWAVSPFLFWSPCQPALNPPTAGPVACFLSQSRPGLKCGTPWGQVWSGPGRQNDLSSRPSEMLSMSCLVRHFITVVGVVPYCPPTAALQNQIHFVSASLLKLLWRFGPSMVLGLASSSAKNSWNRHVNSRGDACLHRWLFLLKTDIRPVLLSASRSWPGCAMTAPLPFCLPTAKVRSTQFSPSMFLRNTQRTMTALHHQY